MSNFPEDAREFSPKLRPPSDLQLRALRQIIVSGFIDQIAVRKDLVDASVSHGTQRSTCRNVAYQAMGVEEEVFIHPSSVIFETSPPGYIAFQEIVQTSRPYLKFVTVVNPSWLSTLGPALCTFSKKATSGDLKRLATENLVTLFGPGRWELPPVQPSS